MAFQGVGGWSGSPAPMVQAIRGNLVCREFKNSNKLTKSQSIFYYHLDWQFQTILTSPCWGKMAPTQPPLLGSPLVLVLSILSSVLQPVSFNSHFTDRRRKARETGANGRMGIYCKQSDSQVCIFNL